MSIAVKIYIDNQVLNGKLIRSADKNSLLFDHANGKYLISANARSVKISLSGEVGYELFIEKFGEARLSLVYGENKTFPTDLKLLKFISSHDDNGGKIEISYFVPPLYDDEDEDETPQAFSLAYKIV
ncbi:MAG: hypothetical protein IKC64_05030 [Clostridia bacterium]|nr:hypothetical protein [Clostridia bacterium]